MIALRFFTRNWLPVLLWMAIIFAGSTDWLSAGRTSRWLTPMLRWIKPDISARALARAHFVVRKAGHVAEYAILAWLLSRALAPSGLLGTGAGHWWNGWPVLLAAVIYACTDEWHQSLTQTRMGSLWDVGYDTLGALLGWSVFHGWRRWRHG